MAALPKFEIEVIEISKSGYLECSLGMADLTWVTCRMPGRVQRWIGGELPLIVDISPGMSDVMRNAGFEGRISIPGFHVRLEAFLDEVGGIERLPALLKAMDAVSNATRRLNDAQSELEEVTAATWSTDTSPFEMFWSPRAHDDGFLQNSIGAFDGWRWEDFEKTHPQPGTGFFSPEAKAWNLAYGDFVRKEAPPYVFGTKADAWEMTAQSIREALADDPEELPDISMIIEGELADHHEEAMDRVEDMDGLQAIVDAWYPHAGSVDAEDLALEGQVAAWSAKQAIVSFWPDMTVALPAFEDATHQEAILWSERRLAEKEEVLAELKDSWFTPMMLSKIEQKSTTHSPS